MEANELRDLLCKRLDIKPGDHLQCPREKSFMTPCIVRDGDIAMLNDEDDKHCVGCNADVMALLEEEKKKAGT